MSLSILLRCSDIEKTRDFYESVLCFGVTSTAENTITVIKSGARLVFTSQELWNKPPGFSGTIYITVADVDEYFPSLLAKQPSRGPCKRCHTGAGSSPLLTATGI